MIAAVYARKSTEQNAVVDEAKSVTRQVEHARAYAASRGWTIADEHVYVDDAISGAEFQNRPGYMRLLNSLKPEAPFQVLIISELARLGREQLETGYACKQLSQAGVRIYSYLENREIALENATDVFLLSAVAFAAEIEREKARQRVSDAMTRKARAGYVCGGEPVGYRNREVSGPDGRRSHVEREVCEPEAAIVRRIFALCAGGKGVKGIAKLLNQEGVPSPRPKLSRPRAWAPSSVRAVLHNEVYRGVHIWNKRSGRTDGANEHAAVGRE
jgi:site-specific DNA recombinase